MTDPERDPVDEGGPAYDQEDIDFWNWVGGDDPWPDDYFVEEYDDSDPESSDEDEPG